MLSLCDGCVSHRVVRHRCPAAELDGEAMSKVWTSCDVSCRFCGWKKAYRLERYARQRLKKLCPGCGETALRMVVHQHTTEVLETQEQSWDGCEPARARADAKRREQWESMLRFAGCIPNRTEEEKAAFRKHAVASHPDLGGSCEEFKQFTYQKESLS
jgi:hypothetical protein